MGTWEACAGAVERAAAVAGGCAGCRLGRAMPAAWIRLGGLFKELVARAPSTPPTSDPGVGAQGPPVTTLQVPMHRWRGAGWSQPDCGGNRVEILFPSPASLSLPVTLGHGKSQSSRYVPCNTQRQAQASVPAPRALQAGATPAALLSPARPGPSSRPLVRVPALPRAVLVRKTLAFTLALRSGEHSGFSGPLNSFSACVSGF